MTTDITRSADITRPDLPRMQVAAAAEFAPPSAPEAADTAVLPSVSLASTGLLVPSDSSVPPTATNKDRRKSAALLSHPIPVLLVIFAVQIALSCRLIWSNTAFEDEALYIWAGHMEWSHWLNQTSIPMFQNYFSGAPVIYPPIAAILDSLGGLVAARLLSLAFILGSTALLYAVSTRFFGRLAGFSAAALFAFFGPTQFLSGFATFDAMAIFLLALASWLVVRSEGLSSELILISAGLVLAAADATKYATALWTPIVLGLAIVTATKGTWLRRGFRGVRLGAYTGAFISIVLFRDGGATYIHGVLYTTLERQVKGASAPALVIFQDSLNWLWFIAILALAGCVCSIKESWRIRLLCGICTLALFLAPLHQAQIHTTTSLKKHVVFGAWFGAIAAGFALSRAAQAARNKGWRVIAAAAAITVFIGTSQATSMFVDGWPNMAQATKDLATSVPTECPCLLTGREIVEYYLIRNINPVELDSITGAYSFSYYDSSTRRELSGSSAYVQAIHDHYFTVIELDTGEFFPPYSAVLRAINSTPGYHKIAAIPVHYKESGQSLSYVQIWRYEPGTPNQPEDARGGNH